MKAIRNLVLAAAASGVLLAASAQADNNLLGSLQDAATQALNNSSSEKGASSLPNLTSLLNGGDNKLASTNASNAAGVLEYCMKNKVLSTTNSANIKDKLLDKLGLQNASGAQNPDYQQGLDGLLKTGNGQNIDLNNLGGGLSQIKDKVKQKACDVILKQAKSFI